MVEGGLFNTPTLALLVSTPCPASNVRAGDDDNVVSFLEVNRAECARGRERHGTTQSPSRTWSCPMAAPESTARATAWEARPLRALPRD